MNPEIEDLLADELSLALPPEPTYLSLARLFAGQAARHAGLDEDTIEDLKVAASEAVTNAVRAHLDADALDPVMIRARVEPNGLTLEIVDRGRGFDVAQEPPAADTTPPLGLYEGSLGLTLIRALFPKVEIEPNADGGMTVRIPVERDDTP